MSTSLHRTPTHRPLPSSPFQASPPSQSHTSPSITPHTSPTTSFLDRLLPTLSQTWYLGLTSFGGPPVHFSILHHRFVLTHSWLSEQTFQELFAIAQSLPGPASTKMLFNIVLLHDGVLIALVVFLLWALPGAVAMYGLALGVDRVGERLPAEVYALLSGLNASTVGVVALAAVQLAEKAVKGRLTRGLVVWGACAGLCYKALWWFPVVVAVGGVVCGGWEVWGERWWGKWLVKWRRRRGRGGGVDEAGLETSHGAEGIEMGRAGTPSRSDSVQRRVVKTRAAEEAAEDGQRAEASNARAASGEQQATRDEVNNHSVPISTGIGVLALVSAILIALLVSRSLLSEPPRPLGVLSNMYQAGILIFGGGPVVIPLLQEYVVRPGWVSSRDFLIGLAVIQAMPGPNFNFSVYLGALAMASTRYHSLLGAFLGFFGIFAPGILITIGVQGIWAFLRTKPLVISVLRGINATAVGLVFTAVYRLWEIGYLTPEATQGQSLAKEPWWVVVATLTYCEVAWFSVPPPVAIVGGVVLGLCWYGAVGRF